LTENAALTPEEMKTLKDLLNLGRALTNSLSSDQIAHLSAGLRELFPLLRTLRNPEVQKLIKALEESAGFLAELVPYEIAYCKAGVVGNVMETIALLGAIRNALSTETIVRWAENANNVLVTGSQLAAACGGMEGIKAAGEAARQAAHEAGEDRRTIGIIGLLQALKEPEIQKGIKFLLHFARLLGRDGTPGQAPPG